MEASGSSVGLIHAILGTSNRKFFDGVIAVNDRWLDQDAHFVKPLVSFDVSPHSEERFMGQHVRLDARFAHQCCGRMRFRVNHK